MHRLIASLAVLVLFAMTATKASADPLLPPRKDVVASNVLHQQREIDVYLPLERGTYVLRLEGRHPDKTTRVDFDVFRDSGDAEWWKHAVLRLWDERR